MPLLPTAIAMFMPRVIFRGNDRVGDFSLQRFCDIGYGRGRKGLTDFDHVGQRDVLEQFLNNIHQQYPLTRYYYFNKVHKE